MILLRQFLRFGVSGGVVTGVSAAVYWSLSAAGLRAMLANLLAYAISVMIGYVLHSRWSFEGTGRRSAGIGLRFCSGSLLALALNSFWVWTLVDLGGGHPWRAIVPMVFVTPLVSFWYNRRFVFGAA